MPAGETEHFFVKWTNVINPNVLLGTNLKNEKNHLPKDYYVCQVIAVKKCHSMRSSLLSLGLDFLGPCRQSTCMAAFYKGLRPPGEFQSNLSANY